MYQKKLLAALVIGFSLFFQSCFTYKVKPADVTSASAPKSMTYWTYLWGNLESKNKPKHECSRNGLVEVEVKSPFGFSMLTIITLGIVHPVKITWTCHKCVIVE